MTDNKRMLLLITKITELSKSIYNYINTGRYQRQLVEDYNKWNQICSSLWVLGDTLLAIQSYVSKKYTKDVGQRYIFTYGMMQVLFTQQDAVINLSDCFKLKVEINDVFRKIRNIRNISIGHPTKLTRNDYTYYGYISRISLSKNGFTLIRTDQDSQRDQLIDIEFNKLVREQLEAIENIVRSLSEMLLENDKKYKEKYKDKRMISVFHNSMNYNFEKIGEGIYSTGYGKVEFGLTMLLSVKKSYMQFRDLLKERNEFGEYVEYDWNQYIHAIEKL